MGRTKNVYENLKLKLKGLATRFLYTLSRSLSHQSLVKTYLGGNGLEIGALHNPLQVPSSVKVRYVDRMPTPELRTQYPELATKNLVHVDIVDNGEQLKSVEDASQDFVIAHQFLEHCQNPIQAIGHMLRVIKRDGILYLSIPDKRYTFDIHRPTTPVEHLLKDYRDGPEWSQNQHFREWVTFICLGHTSQKNAEADPKLDEECDRLMAMNYSIHYHVWTQTEILELILTLKKELAFPFELETFLKNNDEVILILRKH